MKIVNSMFKKTEKIRYKFADLVLKKLTPSLYKKMCMMSLIGVRADYKIADSVSVVPRPFIKIIKERFDKKLIKGAEIGVARGINSENILKELNIEKLYLIDVWDNYIGGEYKGPMETNYNLTLKKFRNDKRVKIIKDFSSNVVKNIKDDSLDFVYIDGNHIYKYVYQDIEGWFPKIKKGGVIAGHDVFNGPEVLEAVKDFCSKNKIIFNIELPDWWFFKDCEVMTWEIKNQKRD